MKTIGRALGLVVMVAVGCGGGSDDPVDATADAPAGVDAGVDALPACEVPTGAGTEHQGLIEADETWTAAGSPHVVIGNISIRGATVTVERCAVVRVRKGFVFDVGQTIGGEPAAIVARGATFERAVAGEAWGSLRAFPTGHLDLEGVTFTGAGDPDTAVNLGGTLVVVADEETGETDLLRTVDVTITGSGGFGVNLQGGAVFTADSDRLTISESGSLPDGTSVPSRTPFYVTGASFSSIPPGTYTGNDVDEVMVAAASNITGDATFHERGIPYHLSDGFAMAPPTTADVGGLSTLTIEAGVTLRFDAGVAAYAMTLGVSSGGTPELIRPVRVVAAGTEAAPIVFTSRAAAPVAGDWGGIEWRGGPPDGNVMQHVTIAYAGGDSGSSGFGCGPGDNDAALIIANWRPDDAFITDSTFLDSAGGGIVSGWASDAAGPELRSNNTFTRVGVCEVSRWADGNGSCPSTPPICL